MSDQSLIDCPICQRQAHANYYQSWHRDIKCHECGYNDNSGILGSPPMGDASARKDEDRFATDGQRHENSKGLKAESPATQTLIQKLEKQQAYHYALEKECQELTGDTPHCSQSYLEAAKGNAIGECIAIIMQHNRSEISVIDTLKADGHTVMEIAKTLCACHLTDGFCTPENKKDCKCIKLAQEATKAIRFRERFTRPEVAALATKREYGSHASYELARTINEGENNNLPIPDDLNPRTSRAGSQAPDNATEIEGGAS